MNQTLKGEKYVTEGFQKKREQTWDIVPTGKEGSDTLNLVSQPP